MNLAEKTAVEAYHKMRYSSLPVEKLPAWADLNGIQLHGVTVASHIVDENGADKGGGLIATQNHEPGAPLVTVPSELILNKASIETAAKIDPTLRQILQDVGPDFIQSPRTLIMIFLLVQLTYSSPDLKEGSKTVKLPLTDYVNFLPKSIYIPTFYQDETALLQGTSLATALEQKLSRLEAEFEHLQAMTQSVKWCRDCWWDEERGILKLDDWKLADAIYRSRAFEIPQTQGESMSPVIDMVNHASDGKHNAVFVLDDQNSLALICKDRPVMKGEEITILYGVGGACEMIFSYGFLEEKAQSAREMFLPLSLPSDDPLKHIKTKFAQEAPALRLFVDENGHVQWESALVWWACVNEEDGLGFDVLRLNSGATELSATWKGASLRPADLREKLNEDPQKDVFLLRAIVFLQGYVETQGGKLTVGQDTFDAGAAAGIYGPVVDMIKRLRDLEMDLLAASHEMLENEKLRLLESETVRAYLNHQNNPDRADGAEDEDFS